MTQEIIFDGGVHISLSGVRYLIICDPLTPFSMCSKENGLKKKNLVTKFVLLIGILRQKTPKITNKSPGGPVEHAKRYKVLLTIYSP